MTGWLRSALVAVAVVGGVMGLTRGSAAAEPLALFVSPRGNDAWGGGAAEPNAGQTDGPFATLARARDEIRRRKAAGPLPQGAVVRVRGGTYFLPETFTLGPQDSGAPDAPVVYEAYPDEAPVLSGGVRLGGWNVAKGRWELDVPQARDGSWTFNQLFVNGCRRYRPRWPRQGYATIEAAVPPTPAHARQGYDRFRFRPGDLRPEWAARGDVEVLAFHTWTVSRLPVREIDPASRVVTFAGTTRTLADYGTLKAGGRYLVENVAEELKAPGQWHLDAKAGTLRYLPESGEEPGKAEVIAPRLRVLVRLHADGAKGEAVRCVVFRGLSFQHSNWVLPPEGYSSPQAEEPVNGAVSAEGARDCVFERCRFTHLGTYALELGAWCRDNTARDCEMSDLGAGGVKIGTPGVYGKDEDLARRNTISGCTLAGGGRVHPAAVGVWVGQSHHNTIEHNDIYDFYYTGVSMGWTWGYGRGGAHHNRVIENHIHDLGQGVLSDMGGIYTLGVCPGTILKGNLIHHVESYSYGGWGIYPDEGTSNLRAENNVVYRTKTGGFHQHYGQENEIVNNIFAFGREHQLERTRPETHLSFVFDRNIVLWDSDAPLLKGRWDQGPYVTAMDHNTYWNGGRRMLFGQVPFDQWQKGGQDPHSVIAEPGFENAADPELAEWRLRKDSPAVLAAGFVPIDVRRAGRPKDSPGPRPAGPRWPEAFPTRLPPEQKGSPRIDTDEHR